MCSRKLTSWELLNIGSLDESGNVKPEFAPYFPDKHWQGIIVNVQNTRAHKPNRRSACFNGERDWES